MLKERNTYSTDGEKLNVLLVASSDNQCSFFIHLSLYLHIRDYNGLALTFKHNFWFLSNEANVMLRDQIFARFL